MDYKKIILVNHFINTIINKNTEKKYELVFEMKGKAYTGLFLDVDEYGHEFFLEYNRTYPGVGYDKNNNIFMTNHQDAVQTIRSAFFEYAFGPDKDQQFHPDMKKYTSRPCMVFKDIVNFVSEYDTDSHNIEINHSNLIQDLKNIDTEKQLDFYLSLDDDFTPVSLIDNSLIEKKNE